MSPLLYTTNLLWDNAPSLDLIKEPVIAHLKKKSLINIHKINRLDYIKYVYIKCHKNIFQFLLKLWGQQLNSATGAEKTAVKHKMTRATFTQTQVYLKPLVRKLKKKNLPDDICESLCEITKHLLERNYIMVRTFLNHLIELLCICTVNNVIIMLNAHGKTKIEVMQ